MPVKIQVFKCDFHGVNQRMEDYDLELPRGEKKFQVTRTRPGNVRSIGLIFWQLRFAGLRSGPHVSGQLPGTIFLRSLNPLETFP